MSRPKALLVLGLVLVAGLVGNRYSPRATAVVAGCLMVAGGLKILRDRYVLHLPQQKAWWGCVFILAGGFWIYRALGSPV
jgi:hypothetical protein